MVSLNSGRNPVTKPAYEIVILGDVPEQDRERLRETLNSLTSDFELALDKDVGVRNSATLDQRNVKAATAAAYFFNGVANDRDALGQLVAANIPIIPVVASEAEFSGLPEIVRGSNGLQRNSRDADLTELASALLECVGLLRQQRRVFISYRRQESRVAAVQLHDALSSKCFDVFLDTHDIRPGREFQDELWHFMSDCDVMVMLDTPGYFDSRWTREEIGRARLKNIHVLRVVWPGHSPNRMSDLAQTIYLGKRDLHCRKETISEKRVDEIALAVESLRSRSIAARHIAIVGKLKSEVANASGTVEGIGAHRALRISLMNGGKVWAFPVVGVPNAEILNEISDKVSCSDEDYPPILVYDHFGIHERWETHLTWLNDNISSVDLLKLSGAAWDLLSWENS